MSENTGKSILAVDDKEFFLQTLRKFLHDTEYKLTCSTSVKIALNFLSKAKPDLFILDIEMPEMNGYELAHKIREMGQTAPIVFLTGNSTHGSEEDLKKAGITDFAIKPISREQILEKIRKFI